MFVLFPQLVKFNKLKISQAVVLKGATYENWPLVKVESLKKKWGSAYHQITAAKCICRWLEITVVSILTSVDSVSCRIFFSSGGRLSGEPWRRKQMTLDCRFYFYAQHNPHGKWLLKG